MAVGKITTKHGTKKRWTTNEYYRIGEFGFLGDGRSELIEGEIFMMSPQGGRHAQVILLLLKTLQAAFGAGFHVRVQMPLHLSDFSEPEPDISVIVGDPIDFPDHPTTALLVVEVSDSSLTYDRVKKQPLYANAGIPEYWIANLDTNTLEVHRQPSDGGYLDVRTLQSSDSVSPLALPGVQIAVSSFLP